VFSIGGVSEKGPLLFYYGGSQMYQPLLSCPLGVDAFNYMYVIIAIDLPQGFSNAARLHGNDNRGKEI